MEVQRVRGPCRGRLAVLAMLALYAASAKTVLFDFEGPKGAEGVTLVDGRHYGYSITNAFATGGERSYHMRFSQWGEDAAGYDMYPWTTFRIPRELSDWRGYDRLAFDIVTTGPGGDLFSLLIRSTNKVESLAFRYRWVGHSQGLKRFVVPLDKWSDEVRADCLYSLTFIIRMPQATDFYLDEIALYRPGETIPPPDGRGVTDDLLPFLGRYIDSLKEGNEESGRIVRHGASMRAFLADCAARGTASDGMAVGQARSTERVMPRDAFTARAADEVSVRLARNETESFQIVVANLNEDLRDVGVAVEGDFVGEGGAGTFAAANVRPCVTGFGNVYERATYHAHPGDRAHLGWYPDPILDFLQTADVKGDDVQSFWVRVKAPDGQAPGCYRGALVVSATRADGRRVSRRVPARIRVNAFTLPRTSPLPLMITFHPETSSTVFEREARRRIARDPKSPINIWRRHFAKWVDFLADHYITMSWLYGNDTAQMKDMYLPAWRRLREQGRLGAHCIGNWNYVPDGPDGEKSWREGMLATLRRRYEMARAEGFLDGAYLYGADEVTMKFIENCRRAAELLHEHIPGVPVVTTGCCQGGGVKGSPGEPLGGVIDMFVPTTAAWRRGVADPSKVRAEGRQLGWYICNNPDYPYAQMFTESEPIEARMLMGIMAAKYDPAAFLIWQISIWNSEHVVETGPFTGIRERTWTNDNGDGCWVHVGPDGVPLATIRLENFRDGLEDLWYARLYEKKFGRKPAIPETLLRDLRDFSRDQAGLAAWRDAIADELEK